MGTIKDALATILAELATPVVAKTIVGALPSEAESDVGSIDLVSAQALVRQVETGLRLFGAHTPPGLSRLLRTRCTGSTTPETVVVATAVRTDEDVLVVQERCQSICRDFFDNDERLGLSSAAYQLAWSIRRHANEGVIWLELGEDEHGVILTIVASDQSPELIHPSPNGVGPANPEVEASWVGIRSYFDHLEFATSPDGVMVVRGSKRAHRDR